LPEEQRRLQGKHKAQQASARLYSRDDVHGALQFQESIVAAIQGGFRPSTPLCKGRSASDGRACIPTATVFQSCT
jgi:hypothetical protein